MTNLRVTAACNVKILLRMNMLKSLNLKLLIFILAVILITYDALIIAQQISGLEYISPVPGSKYVSPDTKILIRPGNVLSQAAINNSLISVTASLSGHHSGKLTLSDDSRTLIFSPDNPFLANEDVTVILNNGLLAQSEKNVDSFTFKFRTIKVSPYLYPDKPADFPSKKTGDLKISSFLPDTSLPPDLPQIVIDQSNNPSPGYIFLCPEPYLMIVDNDGTPVFYRNTGGNIYDFDLQPDGELTYFIYPTDCYGLDSNLNQVRTFITTDGFTPDVHELRVLNNGNYFILGKRNAYVDMSKIVNGGQTNADIIDGDIQEFDASGNLIFQWDGLDHYYITDVDNEVDLTQPTIDFTHLNSIEFDSDGNLLLSARNLDEITKINLHTGNIVWRLGGKNNQFKFINDSVGFSRQHDIRRFSNGDISLFDNGVYHPQQISSAVEYKLDEVNKTATLVRRIYFDNLFTDTEGNVEELPNGNRLISWGHNYDPVVTEIKPDGSVAYEISYQLYYDTYRSFRYIWQTNLFSTNIDSIDFGTVTPGDSVIKNITIYNPQTDDLTINGFYCTDPSFSTNANLPITITPKDSVSIPVIFKPESNGNFSASFNIRDFGMYQSMSQMIARQVMLKGTTDNVSEVNNSIALPKQFELFQNFPNPFNPSTVIGYEIPTAENVVLKVYNVLGKEVASLVDKDEQAGNYSVIFSADAFNLSSGVYFYRLRAGNFSDTKKFILLR